MGFYIDVDVLHGKSRKKIGHIQNKKGGLGKAIFMFKPQNFFFDKKNNEFTCKTLVKDAIANLLEVEKQIKKTDTSDIFYDEWSKSAMKAYLIAFRKFSNFLENFEDTDYVFADMSEGLLSFNEASLDKFKAEIDYENAMEFLSNILSGAYSNYFPDKYTYARSKILMSELKKCLKIEFPDIVKFYEDYNFISCCTMGKTKILQMKGNIIFKKRTDDEEEVFYDSDKYLLPVFALLQKRNIHMARTYEKSYACPSERGYKVIFSFDVSE